MKPATRADSRMATRHFLLTNDGHMEEFSEAEAARVASGTASLPRFADSSLRYVQVAFDDQANDSGEIRVYTMGAIVGFDAEGRLAEASPPDSEKQQLSRFEHDACVQFALRDTIPERYVLN